MFERVYSKNEKWNIFDFGWRKYKKIVIWCEVFFVYLYKVSKFLLELSLCVDVKLGYYI